MRVNATTRGSTSTSSSCTTRSPAGVCLFSPPWGPARRAPSAPPGTPDVTRSRAMRSRGARLIQPGHSAPRFCTYPACTMTRTPILLTAVALTALTALAAVGAAHAAAPKRPLNVVSLNDPTIGGRLFLGRTPLQVTSAFGKPSARTTTRTSATLRYGHWTISFKKRASDGKLIAYAARAAGGTLTGVRGHRLLTPSYSRAQIKAGVTAEVKLVKDGNFNEWMPRGAASFVGLDFPRTTHCGSGSHG